MNLDDSILSKLTDEQKNQIEAAQSPEELLAMAKEAGYELTREQLEAVSGGNCRLFGEFWKCTDEEWP